MRDTGAVKRIKPGVKTLDLNVKAAKSIDELGALTKLDTLVLRGWAMNLAPLAKLTQLRHLTLHLHRGVKGLDHLAALTKLETLQIEESSIANLEIVSGMTALVELKIKGGLATAKGIGGARRLEKVELHRTQITSLAPLAPLTRLRELSLMFSRKLVDLRGIEKLPSLRELDLCDVRGPLRSLAPLAKLTRLEGLDLRFTRITGGWSPLYKLKRLASLQGEATAAQLAALHKHLPRTMLDVDVDEDGDDGIEVGPVLVYPAKDGDPWTISQDLVDDLGVDDQNEVEELVAKAFKKAQPKLCKKVEMDSEGDAFVATSHDRKAIMALAKLIAKLVAKLVDDDDDDDD